MPIQLHTYEIIMLLSGTVILSYLFNMLSRKTQIPSVLLLIATGLGIQQLLQLYGYNAINVSKLVKILGAVGIIMIVLEAAMDLTVNREKLPLIRNSFLSATGIFVFSRGALEQHIDGCANRSQIEGRLLAVDQLLQALQSLVHFCL